MLIFFTRKKTSSLFGHSLAQEWSHQVRVNNQLPPPPAVTNRENLLEDVNMRPAHNEEVPFLILPASRILGYGEPRPFLLPTVYQSGVINEGSCVIFSPALEVNMTDELEQRFNATQHSWEQHSHIGHALWQLSPHSSRYLSATSGNVSWIDRLGKLVLKPLFCSWFPVQTSVRQFRILFFFFFLVM